MNILEARKIGKEACINKLGKIAITNRKYSTFAYGETPEGYYCFYGVDNKRKPSSDLKLTSNKFPYYASCYVNLDSGDIKYGKCRLPKDL